MDTWRHATIFRLALINLTAVALLAAAANAGYLTEIYNTDHFYIVHIMAAVFVLGSFSTMRRVWQASKTLNNLGSSEILRDLKDLRSPGARQNYLAAVKYRLAHRTAALRYLPSLLLLLGLLGTVAGFIEGLSGISPESVSNVSAVPAMMGTLLAGMFSAFLKTLCGGVLNIWLNQELRVLEAADVSIVTRSSIQAERYHARA